MYEKKSHSENMIIFFLTHTHHLQALLFSYHIYIYIYFFFRFSTKQQTLKKNLTAKKGIIYCQNRFLRHITSVSFMVKTSTSFL